MRRLYISGGERPIAYFESYFRADRYMYTVKLRPTARARPEGRRRPVGATNVVEKGAWPPWRAADNRPMVRPHPAPCIPRAKPAPLRAAPPPCCCCATRPRGIEVLMTRRSADASFAPNAYVFPGAASTKADVEARTLARRRRTQSRAQLTQSIAAVRESFEELGVLLAHHADGRPVTSAEVAAMDRSGTPASSFAEQCRVRGLRLDCDGIYTLAHWITRPRPAQALRRSLPGGAHAENQVPLADGAEQFEPEWVRPADALERHGRKAFFMIFPTVRTLERLARFETVDAVLQACAGEKPLWTSTPRAGLLKGKEARYMEHESPFGELALVCPDGQIAHALDWQHEQPVPLLKNVQRLTASNGGVMTGPGTNSYIVGDARSGYVVIDPGPNDFDHIGRLLARDRRRHPHDRMHPFAHRPFARCPTAAGAVQEQTADLGLPSAPTAHPSARFTPDRALRQGERLVLVGLGEQAHAAAWCTRRAHAANHLCLVLEEDALLFSGDHVLNGSTTVINPPDGNMDAYLDSLDLLDASCAAAGVAFILPAHGYVIGEARAAIARLKAHRLAREAKIAAAMRERPDGTPDDWLPLAYARRARAHVADGGALAGGARGADPAHGRPE